MRQGFFHVPRAWFLQTMRLTHGHAPREFSMHSHALGTLAMHPVHLKKCRAQASFLAFLWVKPALLAQTQVETFTINTSLRHSEFLVQKCGSSRERQF